jgi:arsenate reductase
MHITLYGIPNCDTVKKARAWLTGNGIEHGFHDFKKAGVSIELIAGWLVYLPWETLVNRRGTTWRALPQERKDAVADADSAIALMLDYPSVIKRPVLIMDDAAHAGFSVGLYQGLFAGTLPALSSKPAPP